MRRFFFTLLRTLPRPWLIRLSYVFRLFAPLFLKGKKVECNVCGKHYGRFLPYGSLSRQRLNVLCPNCLSLERHRLIWLYLQRETDLFTAPHKMLHIAPEQCFYKRFRQMEQLHYTTADLESPLADVHFDLHDIPFEDKDFDVLMCNHVLEHVKDDKRCMQELFRVLRPGGFAVFQVPIDYNREQTLEDASVTDPKERERLYWQVDHLRLYGRDYGKRLRQAGFKVREIPYAKQLKSEEAARWRLPLKEVLYICSK